MRDLKGTTSAHLRLGSSGGSDLLGEEDVVDVGENTTLGNGHTSQQLVELLVVADGKLNMAGVDAVLLVVAGSIAGQLQDLSREVLKHGGEVDRGTRANTAGEVAPLQVAVNATNRELKTGLAGARFALASNGFGLASLTLSTTSSSSSSRHFENEKMTRVERLALNDIVSKLRSYRNFQKVLKKCLENL